MALLTQVPVVLEERQIPHFNRAIDCLNKRHLYVDNSIMGSGKTVVTIKVAQARGTRLLVICPAKACDVWQNECKKYGVEMVTGGAISYQKIAGSGTKTELKHGLLHRIPQQKGYPVYKPTDFLLAHLRVGLTVVFDEGHNMKNMNSYHEACKAITSLIILGDQTKENRTCLSRFIVLSGTMFTKEEHIKNFLKFSCIIRKHKLFSPKDKEHGLTNMMTYAYEHNKKGYEEFMQNPENAFPTNISDAKIWTVKFYCQIVQPFLASHMPGPNTPFGLNIYNGIYTLSPERKIELDAALKELKDKAIDETTGLMKKGAFGFGAELAKIDNAKREVFASEALRHLKNDPKCKVIVFIQHKDPVAYVASTLHAKGYNVLCIDGSVSMKKRTEMISMFQTDSRFRVLVATSGTCDQAVSLHDTVGDAPRHVLISPSFMITELQQLVYRAYRTGQKSDVEVSLVYGDTGDYSSHSEEETVEQKIMNILRKRSEMLMNTNEHQKEDGVKFPSEYPNIDMSELQMT